MTVADLAPWITPAILLGVFAWLRSDMRELRTDMRELRERMDRFDERFRAVEQDLAEMKGKLTFIENYILRRNEPAADPAE
ncbi:MAG: hypothetical protein OXN81_20170 [Alphaproteobacteria bacterium]|nr:hypothetical protein [Alphaproteobacteria bacterium]